MNWATFWLQHMAVLSILRRHDHFIYAPYPLIIACTRAKEKDSENRIPKYSHI